MNIVKQKNIEIKGKTGIIPGFPLVLTAGVEPARREAGDFKSPVSAIPPCQRFRTAIIAWRSGQSQRKCELQRLTTLKSTGVTVIIGKKGEGRSFHELS